MTDTLKQALLQELHFIWEAHANVGLDGFMAFYSEPQQDPWRANDVGVTIWFNRTDTQSAVDKLLEYYNNGNLPNSTLLLNPVIHTHSEDTYTPIGSGIFWATGFALGIANLTDDQITRPQDKGVLCSTISRGDNHHAGLKMVGIADSALPVCDDGRTVQGCKELYELSNIQSDIYAPYYILSGLNYLCLHGIFNHRNAMDLLPDDHQDIASAVRQKHMPLQTLIEATQCFIAYDRLHALYEHFGTDISKIEHNNRFFNLCARDLNLFDRTGPMRKGAEDKFEFVVPGYIPRGAVTVLAAAGGTGKSSAAHLLCVLASIDYKENEQRPQWLGQEINDEVCDGICVYFSGEDGPAIINARGELFDPEGRAERLQFHRTEFADQDMSFGDYLLQLRKMPKVSIVVIDPARKYLSGDENDSDVVSEFFEAIEEFAIEKNCGMIVVHHLQKGAKPTSAREVLDELRGSQVFVDRARVVLGMCRDDKHTIVGLAKCNIPPSLGMVMEERLFTRNPKTLQLQWLPGEAGVRRDYLTEDEIAELELKEFLEQLPPEEREKALEKRQRADRE